MTEGLLDAIVAGARRAASERQKVVDRGTLEKRIALRGPRGVMFEESLGRPGLRVIAECKRRSPSRGVLRETYDPAAIAAGYEANGAAAISVLTEPSFFDGDLSHLSAVRAHVSAPLLRKDFIVTDYQLIEAAAHGADAALLIVAALDDEAIARLMATAKAIGLATLVEVHDRTELTRAVAAGATVIGVNSRNLRTLHVDTAVLDDLGPLIPRETIAVAESGLKTSSDLIRLKQAGYRAFLIGERFMTEPDPGRALGRMCADVERPWA